MDVPPFFKGVKPLKNGAKQKSHFLLCELKRPWKDFFNKLLAQTSETAEKDGRIRSGFPGPTTGPRPPASNGRGGLVPPASPRACRDINGAA